jgi:hypothetical protein
MPFTGLVFTEFTVCWRELDTHSQWGSCALNRKIYYSLRVMRGIEGSALNFCATTTFPKILKAFGYY